jgi:hypothetical protein
MNPTEIGQELEVKKQVEVFLSGGCAMSWQL